MNNKISAVFWFLVAFMNAHTALSLYKDGYPGMAVFLYALAIASIAAARHFWIV
jgi:hypothetical protein